MSQKRSKYETESTAVDSDDGKEFTLLKKVVKGDYKEAVDLIVKDQHRIKKKPSSSRPMTWQDIVTGVILTSIVIIILALIFGIIGYILWLYVDMYSLIISFCVFIVLLFCCYKFLI